MESDLIKKMINELLDKKIDVKGNSIGPYKTDLIREEERVLFEQIVRSYLLEDRDKKIGVLEAKVFAYEQIISNSNFSSIVTNALIVGHKQGLWES